MSHFLGNGIKTVHKYFNLTPFDIYTLSYCLCHSNCEWKLGLDLEKLTSVFPAQNCDSFYSGWIDSLHIGYLTGSGLERFFSLPQTLLSNLSRLVFFRSYSVSMLTMAVTNLIRRGKYSNLLHFYMGNEAGFTGVGDLVDALQASCPRLTTLGTKGSVFTPSDMLPLCKYICSPACLTELSLMKSEFQLLISAIPCAKSLIHLDLSNNVLPSSDIEMLLVALSVKSSLKILILESCSIDGEGA